MLKITKKTKKLKPEKFYTLLAFFVVFLSVASAQTSTTVTTRKTNKSIETRKTPPPAPLPPRAALEIGGRVVNTTGIPAEKSIIVDAGADISFCVGNSNLKVSGWDRNEVRAMVENGTYVGFKVLNKTPQNQPAVLKILGYDPAKNPSIGLNECLRGENIEIDVPRGATVRISGRQYEAEVSSVTKAEVKNNGGNIVVNNVSKGVYAQTYEGDLRVENVGGEITLTNTNGNIFAYNAKPLEFSNNFVAKTSSGAIRLQAVDYPQLKANSTSGTINFSGTIISGGQYYFSTQNGSIQLLIPKKSSFAVAATYGYGDFKSDIQMVNVTKTPGQPQKLTGQTGAGDATLTLSTYVGSINIKTNEP